jgi:hypothetical protein
MIRSFIRHRVRDYPTWREVYDGFADVQKAGGVRAEAVYRSVDDPNDVTVTHDLEDVETARAFFASPDLKDAMMRAGVEGDPVLVLGEEA